MKQTLTVEDLKNLAGKVSGLYGDEYILCHPDNLRLLKEGYTPERGAAGHPYFFMPETLYGIEVRTDVNVPKYSRKWQFPKTPFVEYEESDEVWAKPINFGRYIDTDEPVFYLIKNWSMIFDHSFYNTWKVPSYLLTSI